MEKSLKPTRKWIAAQVTLGMGVVLMLVTGDPEISDPEKVAIGTFIAEAVVSWLVPNEDTPGGVPVR